ncbi:hypothetical protein Q1695_009624 [Nippostrongylus brasiliensis]|nr:hypothetical protein Q1695_009624 [Nippostrongylus brasiliensis]
MFDKNIVYPGKFRSGKSYDNTTVSPPAKCRREDGVASRQEGSANFLGGRRSSGNWRGTDGARNRRTGRRPSPAAPRPEASRGPCYNCGGSGHFRRECPSPVEGRRRPPSGTGEVRRVRFASPAGSFSRAQPRTKDQQSELEQSRSRIAALLQRNEELARSSYEAPPALPPPKIGGLPDELWTMLDQQKMMNHFALVATPRSSPPASSGERMEEERDEAFEFERERRSDVRPARPSPSGPAAPAQSTEPPFTGCTMFPPPKARHRYTV